ncbi:hypothetical protein BDR26DRAFT_231140 [Obelidium mucronatum]|nr:hypothetical protein BDR26DRAFT_231140 [Obelidium mucronatum]
MALFSVMRTYTHLYINYPHHPNTTQPNTTQQQTGMSGTDARELLDSGYIAKLCNASDIIIIADTVPDGRAILLSLLEPSESLNRCKSNIVIEMTNRYDWMVPDRQVYHEMLRRIFKLNPKNLFWTANNPFEGPFMHANVGGEVFPKVRLLRPLGAWNVDVENSHMTHGMPLNQETNISTQNMLAMVKNVEKVNRPIVGDLVDYYCMPVAKLPKKYGGPAGLLKYKGFIDFPYQVSVMKFYENIAFGVPQVLPTPRFLHALVKFFCFLIF